MDRVIIVICDFMCLCLCVCSLKGKQLELSTPNLVNIQCMTVARHALILKSKGAR